MFLSQIQVSFFSGSRKQQVDTNIRIRIPLLSRNSDKKPLSLRPLRLCGEFVFGQGWFVIQF